METAQLPLIIGTDEDGIFIGIPFRILKIQPKRHRYFPASGMEHSQDDPREALDPQDGGRDDLIGEVMRMLRLRSAQAKSKQNLSRLAG